MYHHCTNCSKPLGFLEDGDVIQCLKCGRWHECFDSLEDITIGGQVPTAIVTCSRVDVARIAREPVPGMDNYDLLDAFEVSALAMEPELTYYDERVCGFRPTNAA